MRAHPNRARSSKSTERDSPCKSLIYSHSSQSTGQPIPAQIIGGGCTIGSFSRRFGKLTVLDHIDLEIAEGEFVTLLGRNGSGKLGLDPKALGGAKPARALALKALREVGLEHRVDAWSSTLSGGEAQRAALARALVREPNLLLLDEPFASLDALTRIKMYGLVASLWQAHHPAVLLVTHDVDEAIALADRVLVLANGKLIVEKRIGLPRKRQPGQPEFVALWRYFLERLGVEIEDEPAPDIAQNQVTTGG